MPQEFAASTVADGSRNVDQRPVPQPRRLPSTPTTPTPGVLAYENVRIEAAALTKTTPLNNDNLLLPDDPARPSKVPNNKVFLLSDTVAATADGEDDARNGNGPLTPDASPARRVITEMNNLNLDNSGHKNSANKNFEESHKMHNMPVPAPRRLANRSAVVAQEIYENNEQQPPQQQQQQQPSPSSSSSSSSSSSPVPYKPVVQQASTGAISKTTRRAPQLPLPSPPKTSVTPPASTKCSPKTNNTEPSSVHTASGVIVDGLQPPSLGPGHDDDGPSNLRRNQKTTRSNVSLSSTTSGGSSTTGGDAKYAKGSPSTLLKALGESITERVAQRTRGAVHKMDKIQQNSLDKLSNVGKSLHQSSLDRLQDTKRSIQNVRHQLGMKLIGGGGVDLTTADAAADGVRPATRGAKTKPSAGSYDFDRPQTVPANDELFQTISFDSPLRAKVAPVADLSESSYEVPPSVTRKFSLCDGDSEPPPGYSELYNIDDVPGAGRGAFRRNSDLTRSLTDRGAASNVPATPPERPCPQFPAPILQAQSKVAVAGPTNPAVAENDYGRIRAAPLPTIVADSEYTEMAPVPRTSTNRRSDYEETQIRFKAKPLDCSSTRATFDSADCRATIDSERTVPSADFTEAAAVAEQRVPRPGRSDSWTFYDVTGGGDDGVDDDDDDDDYAGGRSTPEPIYVNDEQRKVLADRLPIVPIAEPLYGVVYGPDVLQPTTVPRTKRAMAAAAKRETHEIIREFDPLLDVLASGVQLPACSSKTNELMLLESMLGEETYGTTMARVDGVAATVASLSDEDEEESTAAVVAAVPPTPERVDSLDVAETPPTRGSVIVHQNLSLHARDLPNEDALVAPFLARVDATVREPSKTMWFVDDNPVAEATAPVAVPAAAVSASHRPPIAGRTNPAIDTAVKNYKHFDPPPPPYSESADSLPADAAAPKSPTIAKASMRTRLTNVFNLRRKSSFSNKSQPIATAGNTAATTTSPPSHSTVAVAPQGSVKHLIEMCPRPVLTQRHGQHEGIVIRLPSKATDDILKEQYKAAASVRGGRFQAFADKEMRTAKDNIPLENIVSVQCVSHHKFTDNTLELHCFEITALTPKNSATAAITTAAAHGVVALNNPNMVVGPSTRSAGQMCKYTRSSHLYGVAKESERDIWMQRLLESMTDVLPTSATCRFYRAGWCYMKSSITGQWSGAWCLLQKHKKRLVFYTAASMNVEVLDLRKARCLILKEAEAGETDVLHVEAGPLLMVDCPPFAVYMVMGSARETKVWRHIIMEVAHNNGPSLKEQQLTKDDVSVLVDKCVNFVYAHGSMSEGIYRKSGSEQAINRLLQLFRTDAFGVQITRAEYTEHDVANALKRFMRDLPERLLSRDAHSFNSVTAMPSAADKLEAYKELLARLPTIERQTLRKLLGHLNFIASQQGRNKMTVGNLAIVWGPTLLENKHLRDSDMGFSQTEANVLVDLITMYKNLYQLTADEVAKEVKMLEVLQKYHAAAENLGETVKHSGDLKCWIIIDDAPAGTGTTSAVPDSPTQVNVTLTPTKTAHDICRELASRFRPAREPTALTLSEHILDGDLQRPLHHTERPFDVVLRWSYWPEADRKHNTLRLQPIRLMRDVARALRNLPIVSPNMELRFADVRTRTLRPFVLELADGRVTVMRKEKGNSVVPVRDVELGAVTAYVGAERKRELQTRWAITLVERDVGGKCVLRSRDSPFFGHVIAGSNTNDQLVWYSSIIHSLYGDNILPDADIILT